MALSLALAGAGDGDDPAVAAAALRDRTAPGGGMLMGSEGDTATSSGQQQANECR